VERQCGRAAASRVQHAGEIMSDRTGGGGGGDERKARAASDNVVTCRRASAVN